MFVLGQALYKGLVPARLGITLISSGKIVLFVQFFPHAVRNTEKLNDCP